MKHLEENEFNDIYEEYLTQMKKCPDNIESEVWNAIQRKRHSKSIVLSIVGIAASILILVGIFSTISYQQKKVDIETQFAMIEQALNFTSSELSHEGNSNVDILYEDDVITIVAESQISK